MVIDFEFELGYNRDKAVKLIKELVNESSIDPYEPTEEDRKLMNDDWYSIQADKIHPNGNPMFYEDSVLREFERLLQA